MTLHNFSPRKNGSILKDGQWIGVDLMMLLYSMLRSTAAIWRAQTQLPPVPQRQAQAWMTSWYQIHNFITKLNNVDNVTDIDNIFDNEIITPTRKLNIIDKDDKRINNINYTLSEINFGFGDFLQRYHSVT